MTMFFVLQNKVNRHTKKPLEEQTRVDKYTVNPLVLLQQTTFSLRSVPMWIWLITTTSPNKIKRKHKSAIFEKIREGASFIHIQVMCSYICVYIHTYIHTQYCYYTYGYTFYMLMYIIIITTYIAFYKRNHTL